MHRKENKNSLPFGEHILSIYLIIDNLHISVINRLKVAQGYKKLVLKSSSVGTYLPIGTQNFIYFGLFMSSIFEVYL